VLQRYSELAFLSTSGRPEARPTRRKPQKRGGGEAAPRTQDAWKPRSRKRSRKLRGEDLPDWDDKPVGVLNSSYAEGTRRLRRGRAALARLFGLGSWCRSGSVRVVPSRARPETPRPDRSRRRRCSRVMDREGRRATADADGPEQRPRVKPDGGSARRGTCSRLAPRTSTRGEEKSKRCVANREPRLMDQKMAAGPSSRTTAGIPARRDGRVLRTAPRAGAGNPPASSSGDPRRITATKPGQGAGLRPVRRPRRRPCRDRGVRRDEAQGDRAGPIRRLPGLLAK